MRVEIHNMNSLPFSAYVSVSVPSLCDSKPNSVRGQQTIPLNLSQKRMEFMSIVDCLYIEGQY